MWVLEMLDGRPRWKLCKNSKQLECRIKLKKDRTIRVSAMNNLQKRSLRRWTASSCNFHLEVFRSNSELFPVLDLLRRCLLTQTDLRCNAD